MTDLATIDYFSDADVSQNPYPYWDRLRELGPVTREPFHDVVAVTGYAEVMEAFKDHEHFSAVNAIGGPFPPLPFTPRGDDITAQIEAHRHEFPIHEHMVVMDPPAHDRARHLMRKLLTPRRLKENEEFVRSLADRQIDQVIGNGRCEFLSEYARPFATSAIIDLLGVPDVDRAEFMAALGAELPDGARVGALDGEPVGLDPLQYLDDKFAGYLSARRAAPTGDVLSGMATATLPDGSTPELIEVVKPATFLFAAGQETVTKLLSAAVLVLIENPRYQDILREHPEQIPTFIEEALRMYSPTKVDFPLVRKTTELGGVPLPAGTVVMLCLGAANRDPRKFDDPHEFHPERANVHEHVAFGRGIHTCAGAPLARVEGNITVRRLLDRMRDISADPDRHGSAGDRHYAYDQSFLLRGLSELNLVFEPAR